MTDAINIFIFEKKQRSSAASIEVSYHRTWKAGTRTNFSAMMWIWLFRRKIVWSLLEYSRSSKGLLSLLLLPFSPVRHLLHISNSSTIYICVTLHQLSIPNCGSKSIYTVILSPMSMKPTWSTNIMALCFIFIIYYILHLLLIFIIVHISYGKVYYAVELHL